MIVKRHFDSEDELARFLETDKPRTEDDCWIDGDGTIIDTPEKFMAMLNRDLELRAKRRASGQSSAGDSPAATEPSVGQHADTGS